MERNTQLKESTINIPRYLNIFLENLDPFSDDFVPSRSDLIKQFIEKSIKFQDNDSKIYSIKAEAISILSKIAFLMQLTEKKEITQNELIEYKNLICNSRALDVFLINNESLSSLYDRTLLIKDENILFFENDELREYLAANCVLSFPKPSDVLHYSFDNNSKIIKESWLNVLSFVFELKPIFILDYLNKVCLSEFTHNIEYINKILGYTNFEKVDKKIKEKIFEVIWNYRERIKKGGFDPSMLAKLYTKPIESIFIIKQNYRLFSLIPFLLKSEDINEARLKEIKKKLLEFFPLLKTKFYNDYFVQIIIALNDIEFLYETRKIDNMELSDEELVDAYMQIAPNDPNSLVIFIACLRKGKEEVLHCINNISTKAGIEIILEKLLIYSRIIKKNILWNQSELDQRFFENISIYWNVKIENLVIRILEYLFFKFSNGIGRYKNKPIFRNRLLNILLEKSDYKEIKEINTYLSFKNRRNLLNKLRKYLIKKELDKIIKKISLNKIQSRILLFTLLQSNDEGRTKLCEQYFTEEYKKFKKLEDKDYHQLHLEDRKKFVKSKIYPILLEALQIPSNYLINVPYIGTIIRMFHSAFVDEIEIHNKLTFTKDELSRIEEIVLLYIDSFKYNTYKEYLSSDLEKSEEYISAFHSSILLLKELKIPENKYFQHDTKIVSFLIYSKKKFLYIDISQLIKSLDQDSKKEIVRFYKEEDFDRYHIDNALSFIELCKLYQITVALSILKEMIFNEKYQNPYYIEEIKSASESDLVDSYERLNEVAISAIDAISEINYDEEYFSELFEQIDPEKYVIKKAICRVLIQKSQYENAVKYWLDEIKMDRRNEFYHDSRFFITDYKFKPHIIDLLLFTFELAKEDTGEDIFVHKNILSAWSIIEYFYIKNSANLHFILDIKELIEIIEKNNKTFGRNDFERSLKEIIKAYFDKPITLEDAFEIYRKLENGELYKIRNAIQFNTKLIQENIKRTDYIQKGIEEIKLTLKDYMSEFTYLKQKIDTTYEKLYSLSDKFIKHNEVEILDYYEKVEQWFPEYEKLDDKTQIFLVSGEYLFDKNKNINQEDFSYIVIQYCRAVENELHKSIFKAFHNYMQENSNPKATRGILKNSNWKIETEYKDYRGNLLLFVERWENQRFALEQIITSIENLHIPNINRIRLFKYFEEFLKGRYDYSKLVDKNFLGLIKQIKDDRNAAAHTYKEPFNLKKTNESIKKVKRFFDEWIQITGL